MKIASQQAIPSARRLIRSLRSIGYDFSAAVADLVDNSISAGATEVRIDVEFDGDHSRVRIADNGNGMNEDQLQEAMRYGSERDYDNDSELGKFGLGLKTASLSQCQRLSVASRSSPKAGIHTFCWDLEHIDKTNRWELLIPDRKKQDRILNGYLTNNTGTVVLWERLDRMLGHKHPYGEASRKRLLKMCRELEEHLTMVFHRFLDGEVPDQKLKIILNDNQLKGWDPFARTESETKQLNPICFEIEQEDISGEVTLSPYILPPKDKFSSQDAFNRASGPKKWNLQQGFYIYRANRLIQSGGWCNLRAADEHTKLARIALDFSPQLDDVFGINVAKMRVLLPQEFRDNIQETVDQIVKQARLVYDKKDKSKKVPANSELKTGSSDVYSHGNTSNGGKAPDSNHTEIQTHWTLEELQKKLIENAFSDEKPIIIKVFGRLRRKLGS
jgi:hypothetical protein